MGVRLHEKEAGAVQRQCLQSSRQESVAHTRFYRSPAALFAPALMLKVLWLLIKESVGWAPIPHRAKPALPVSEDGGTARSSIKQQPGDGSEQRPTRPAVEHKEE